MIRVRAFHPVSIALVPFHDGHPHLAIGLKTAFAIPPPGSTQAEAVPSPRIRGDEPLALGGLGAEELAHASDLVPLKAQVDVVIVGHAASGAPATALPVRFAIGPLRRELVAVASAPATALPLVREHLRTLEGAVPTVGPQRPAGARLRRPRRAGRAEMAWGSYVLDLAAAEDGTGYQSAAPEQRVALPFPERAQVVLAGLGPADGGAERWFWLPVVRPFAVVAAGDDAVSVPLTCDTVHVDVDGGLVTLVHRGRFSGRVGHLEILVGLGGEGAPRHPQEAVARRAEARPVPHVTLGAGGEPVVVGAEASPSALDGFDDGPAATSAFEPARMLGAPLPFAATPRGATTRDAPASPAIPREPTPAPRVEATAAMDVARLREALPFGLGDEPAPETSWADATASLPRSPALSGFDEAPSETRPIPVHPQPATPLARAVPETAPPPPLPAPVPSAAPPWSPAPAPLSPSAAIAPPALPLAAALPPPRAELDDAAIGRAPLTTDEVADVMVELESARGPARRKVLARHRLDAVSWAQESARWAAQLEGDAARGESRTLDALMARARARRAERAEG